MHAIPLIKPPPPTGITNKSISGLCSMYSAAHVAEPSVIFSPSNGCIITLRSLSARELMTLKESPMSSHKMTSAPTERQPSIRYGSVVFGIVILAVTPAAAAAHETARAWFPPLAATTPCFFCSLDKF